MRQAFPDDNARLEHIFCRSGLWACADRDLYRIAISFILGFAKMQHAAHHIRQADTLGYGVGTLEGD